MWGLEVPQDRAATCDRAATGPPPRVATGGGGDRCQQAGEAVGVVLCRFSLKQSWGVQSWPEAGLQEEGVGWGLEGVREHRDGTEPSAQEPVGTDRGGWCRPPSSDPDHFLHNIFLKSNPK